MPFFSVFGLRLESGLDFPELPAAGRSRGRASLRIATSRLPSTRWVHETPRPDGRPWLSTGVSRGVAVLRFHGVADFSFACGSLDVVARPGPRVSPDMVRALFLDHVLPRALAGAGHTVLHASAVETGSGAVAFLGESGSGKSTLAASFCAAGARLLADDAVLLDRALNVVPAWPAHRLWPATAESLGAGKGNGDGKRRLGLVSGTWNPARTPLRRVFVLGPAGSISIRPVTGADAILEVVRETYRLDPTDKRSAASEFERLARFGSRIPLFRLRYPHRLNLLPAVRRRILGIFENSL